MKRMLTVILLSCFPFSSYCLDKYNQNLKDLKEEINEVFGARTDNKPVYLITVTRSSKDRINGWVVNNPIMKDTAEVKDVLDLVTTEINAKCHDGHKIIAFNEMFFSQETPLDKNGGADLVTHDSVFRYIKDFNKKVPNSIVFYNVLYKHNKNINKQKALYLYALTLLRENKGYLNYEFTTKSMPQYVWDVINGYFTYNTTTIGKTSKNIVENYVDNHILHGTLDTFSYENFINDPTVKTITSVNTAFKTDFLINRTYCVYNEQLAFHYNKSTYYKENDDSIEIDGCVYDLGDGYPMLDYFDKKPEKILKTISTEICLDFACGVKKNNEWKSERTMGTASKLHIIQSNSVEAWLLSEENYPFDVPILYSDAEYNFPNLRIAFGGMTHCLDLDKTKKIGVTEEAKTGILYKQVQKISLPKRNSSVKVDIDDYYTIWVHKI